MIFDWNDGKNRQLKEERNISFEEIVLAIDEGKVKDVIANSNSTQYPQQ